MPERPICILPGPQYDGTNPGKVGGIKTFPLEVSPKVDQRTRTILTNSGSRKNEKAKLGACAHFQTNEEACSI